MLSPNRQVSNSIKRFSMRPSLNRTWLFVAFIGVALPRLCFPAAGVPKLVDPPASVEQCDRKANRRCPRSGVEHVLHSRPIGGRCPSIPMPARAAPGSPIKPVLLRVYTHETGDVAMAKVLESSGDWRLDDAASDAALDCRFKAGTVDRIPAKTSMKVRYDWDLNALPDDPPEQASARAGGTPNGRIVLVDQEADDLSCEDPTITLPSSILADSRYENVAVTVSARITPSLEVSKVLVDSRPAIPELNDVVAHAFEKMQCTSREPKQRSIWVFRHPELSH